MHRGTLELKNDGSILQKNDLFTNKTCCTLWTTLFVKTKTYFCCFNFGKKQQQKKFLVPFFRVDCIQ